MSSEFSAEVYHNLINAGFFIAAVVQLYICLRRVHAGHRSSYPANWTTGKFLVLRGSQIAIGVLAAGAWIFTFSAIQRVASPFSHGIIADDVGLPLFGALASTFWLLWVATPKAWPARVMYEIIVGFVVLSLIVVFMQYARPGRF